MPGGHWGPWEPYTQTVTYGSQDLVRGFTELVAGAAASAISFSPYQDPPIYQVSQARVCCMAHVQAGASMDTVWYLDSVCPSMSGGLEVLPEASPYNCGLFVLYSGGVGIYSNISIRGTMSAWGIIANKTTTVRGVPSWADQYNAAQPPEFDTEFGKTWKFDYDVFTSLDVTAALNVAAASFQAQFPWNMYGVEVPPTAFETWNPVTGEASYEVWNPNADGLLTWQALVQPSGVSVIAGDPVPCPNILTTGHVWQFVPETLRSGFFAANDPFSAGIGYDPIDSWINPGITFTVKRTGRRRRWLDVAPPLQQRQRSDGLGGSPTHAGRGIATRQHGLHQAGIY